MANIGSLMAFLGIDTSGVDKAEGRVKQLESSTTLSLKKIKNAAVATFTFWGIGSAIKETTLMAARFETLGVVMGVVGNNIGKSRAEMDQYSESLRKNGIAAIESRQVLTQMAQANIDLSKATKLARIAQDAAVIGNINSSEAFQNLIYGIQSAQVDVLRTIGINVSFENSYKKVADQLGRTTASLSDNEKMQIRVNAVMESGRGIAGVYEASMGTAGKQLLSMKRYSDDLKVSLGSVFLPSLSFIVQQMTEALKGANTEMEEGRDIAAEWGKSIREKIIAVSAEFLRLSMLIDKVGGTMTATGALFTFGDTDAKFREWNEMYKKRYDENEKQLQGLADLSVALENEGTSSAAAKKKVDELEKARIAAGKATLLEKNAVVENTEALKKWATVQEKLAKESFLAGFDGQDGPGQELAKKIAEITYEANKMRQEFGQKAEIDAWAASMTNAAKAADGLKESIAIQEELNRHYYDKLEEDAKEQQAIQEQTTKMHEEQLDLVQKNADLLKSLTVSNSTELEMFLTAFEKSNKKSSDSITKIWDHAFERIQDSLADMIYNFEFSWSSILDIVKRGAAEYTAAMIMSPFTGQTTASGTSSPSSTANGASAFTEILSMGTKLSEGMATTQQTVGSLIGMINTNWGNYVSGGTGATTGLYGPTPSGGNIASGMSSTAFASWTAGIGTFLMELANGQDFDRAATTGGGAAAGAYAGGTAGAYIGSLVPVLGTAVGGALGAAIGGILGALGVSKLWGDGNEERSYLDRNYMYDYSAGTGFTQSGMDEVRWSEGSLGLDLLTPVAEQVSKAMLDGMNTVTTNFMGLLEPMGKGTAYTNFLDSFGTTAAGGFFNSGVIDPSRTTGSSGIVTFGQYMAGEDQDDIETSMANMFKGYAKDIIGPLVAGSVDLLTEGYQGVFDALDLSIFTTDAADKLSAGFSDAIALMDITGVIDGDTLQAQLDELDLGTGQLEYILSYIEQVQTAIGTIDEAMDTDRLTSQGKALQDINTKWDTINETLVSLGVNVDNTNSALARQAEIQALNKTVTDDWQSHIDSSTLSSAAQAMNGLFAWYEEQLLIAADLDLDIGLLNTAFAADIQSFYDSISQNIVAYGADLTQASSSIFSAYEEQRSAALNLLSTFNGTAAATSALNDALGVLRTTEVQYLQSINSAIESIKGSFYSSIESMQLDLMKTDKEKYDYFKGQAEKLLLGISTMSDPAQIQETLGKIDSYVNSAWGLLDPAQQQKYGAEFISFLSQAQGIGTTRLEELGAIITANQDDLVTGITDTFDNTDPDLSAAADSITTAAATMDSASLRIDMAVSNFATKVSQMPSHLTVSVTDQGEVAP